MEDNGITVRLAHDEDVASILGILPQITTRPESLSAKVPAVHKALQIFERMELHGNIYLVIAQANHTKTIVGALTLVIVPNFNYNGRPWSIIENVVVSREWRRKGIGQKMMDFATDVAKHNDCFKIQLLSGPRDDQAGFYRSLGFDDANSRGFKKYLVDR